MPRPDQSQARRLEFIPIIAATFAEFGYRRTTTAVLAERCNVRENILYRLWPDKRAMFVAALDYVYQLSETTWYTLLKDVGEQSSPAEVILDYEAKHQGEFGLYRIVFAGLSETDDPDITAALKSLYSRFQRFVAKQVKAHNELFDSDLIADPKTIAWAIIGLGTVANIGRELGLISPAARKRLIGTVGRALL